ncbi:MAG: response regulator [Anaerolineae bacterium]|nr:response regulator [Anaerolineae bacterium]
MAGERILVVDDGQENREFIVEYVLRPYGYEAFTARDGGEGLQMIAEHKPDMILLDYQMPRMNGVEMLQHMQEMGCNIPVILMTFYGSEEVAVEVYRMGVQDYIAKPFTVEEMIVAIERTLSNVRLIREKDALTERLIAANRELQNRLQELNVLHSVGKSVTALMSIEELLPRIVDAAVRLTGADEGYLHIVVQKRLLCQAMKRTNQTRAEPANFEANDTAAMRVVQHGQLVLRSGTGDNEASLAYAPLALRDEIIGVLGVRAKKNAFSKHQAALLSTLTDYAAIAIQNSRSVEQLRQQKENEKGRIRTLFQRFVPPQVVDQILENPDLLRLGGHRREITILFTDIRGYTAYSERLPPERVVEMLNDYLSLAANTIMSYGGTLDKYMGDGLMAIFNAPNEQPDHVQSALEAALTLQQATRQLASQRGDGLSFSTGIHSGEAVVGYIGTDVAMNYTAVGDAVNVAKRLQEAARPGQILIEEHTVARVSDQVQVQALGELKVKGRQQTAIVYELLNVITPHS